MRTFVVGLVFLAAGAYLLIQYVSVWIWVPLFILLGPFAVAGLWGISGARYYYLSKRFWNAVDQYPGWFRPLFLQLAEAHPGVEHVQVELTTAKWAAEQFEAAKPGITAYLIAPETAGDQADCIQVDQLTKLSLWPNWQRTVWELYQSERSSGPNIKDRIRLEAWVRQISENVKEIERKRRSASP